MWSPKLAAAKKGRDSVLLVGAGPWMEGSEEHPSLPIMLGIARPMGIQVVAAGDSLARTCALTAYSQCLIHEHIAVEYLWAETEDR